MVPEANEQGQYKWEDIWLGGRRISGDLTYKEFKNTNCYEDIE